MKKNILFENKLLKKDERLNFILNLIDKEKFFENQKKCRTLVVFIFFPCRHFQIKVKKRHLIQHFIHCIPCNLNIVKIVNSSGVEIILKPVLRVLDVFCYLSLVDLLLRTLILGDKRNLQVNQLKTEVHGVTRGTIFLI